MTEKSPEALSLSLLHGVRSGVPEGSESWQIMQAKQQLQKNRNSLSQ
ncbi:hypothetical protein ABIX86_005545 [Escherichia coli]